MRLRKIFSGMIVAYAATFSASTIAAPLQGGIGHSIAAPVIAEKVWCRHGYCDGDGRDVGGLIGGIVGGVIAAGSASAAAQQDAAAQQHAASCAQRYRSYDPASNTFQAKDGRRYPCQ